MATGVPIAKGQFLEGVIFVGEKLYFVDYAASDVLRVDGDHIVRVWHRDGCGANGLISVGDMLLVACYDQGTVLMISFDGKILKSISADDAGRNFVSPNDLVSDAQGGFYLTSSGRNGILGAVTYLGPDKRVRTVATGIGNANGIALSPDGKLLYIGESCASRLLAYPVEPNGTLGTATVLVHLADVLSGSPERRYVPDGLRTDREGNLYICLYRGGGLAILDSTGKLLKQVDLPAAHHTSLALSADERQMFVTGIDDEPGGTYRGSLYVVPNPIRH